MQIAIHTGESFAESWTRYAGSSATSSNDEWINARFDPKKVLSLPLSVRAQLGPNPRIIDEVAWAVDPLVGQLIDAWKLVRLPQPLLTDRKIGQQREFLFSYRGQRILATSPHGTATATADRFLTDIRHDQIIPAAMHGRYRISTAMIQISTGLGRQPRVADASLLILPPAVPLAVAQQTPHGHQVNLGRYVQRHHSVLFDSLTADPQRREGIQDPLSRAAQRTLSERDDPDRAVARPPQPLIRPQQTIIAATDPHEVAAGDTPDEPRRVVEANHVRRNLDGPEALARRGRPTVIVVRQGEPHLHEIVRSPVTRLAHEDSMPEPLRSAETNPFATHRQGQPAHDRYRIFAITCRIHYVPTSISLGNNTLIQDSWISDVTWSPGAHQAGIGAGGNTGHNSRIVHNNIECARWNVKAPGFVQGCSSALSLYEEPTLDDVLVERSL